MAALRCSLRDAAVATGILPQAGVRATAATHVVIADGNPDHACLDLLLRLRGGRCDGDKTRATAQMFADAEAFCADVPATSSLMLSLQMRDIDPVLSPKTSSVHRDLPEATS